ncbi:MAG: AraC family transcriptional regulator [Mucilaginibacter sp.]
MKTIKVLSNQIKIYNETATNASCNNLQEDFSIRFVLQGHERFRLGKRNLTVHPGSFLAINEGTVFSSSVYADVPANTFAILYSPAFLKTFHRDYLLSETALLDDPFSTGDTAATFLETLYPFSGNMMFNLLHLKGHLANAQHDEALISEYVYRCLLNFYKLYGNEIITKKNQLAVLNPGTKAELFRRLNNAKDYMLSNYNQPISIQEISSHACLSEIHFFRSFKQIYNCSPHQYLIQARLNNAQYMLKNTSYAVSEIVNLIGFDNTSSFIRLFKERFGDTPGSFRGKIVA